MRVVILIELEYVSYILDRMSPDEIDCEIAHGPRFRVQDKGEPDQSISAHISQLTAPIHRG